MYNSSLDLLHRSQHHYDLNNLKVIQHSCLFLTNHRAPFRLEVTPPTTSVLPLLGSPFYRIFLSKIIFYFSLLSSTIIYVSELTEVSEDHMRSA